MGGATVEAGKDFRRELKRVHPDSDVYQLEGHGLIRQKANQQCQTRSSPCQATNPSKVVKIITCALMKDE